MKSFSAAVGVLALAGVACGTSRRSTATATAPQPDSLYSEIRAMDDSLSAAFNAHNINVLMSLFAPDVEFYHDTQGLQDLAAVRAGFTSVFGNNNGMHRQRVDPLEVYPIPNYGAVEVGAHRFCHDENGRPDCGTFRFVQLWRRRDGEWKIARVISYGH